ncbi:MAG: UDP-glucose/GDP-mannose dehydrogenase family protein [Bifidobacteriaceae bacterium]|jgi:UDPglucose 6-dehydrogenase|nr:UDP-glucose/GDP-mannose dehydrogenase family protein [Bifidobacteriaceae bacterium]
MRISVIGCGYLGAVHAAAMASLGHQVIGIDPDPAKIASLSSGRAPFFEPGLPELLRQGLDGGRLSFTTSPSAAAANSVHFICVGTPQLPGSLGADLTALDTATEELMPHLRPGGVVVGKSTVPVGTARPLAARLADAHAALIWNPEFLREGRAVADTLAPDRIVYGLATTTARGFANDTGDSASTARAAGSLDQVYARLLESGVPRLEMSYESAELVKTSANSYLALRVSFINAISDLADSAGADILDVAAALRLDERIGKHFLNPGLGFGGGCLPKDLHALTSRAEQLDAPLTAALLSTADQINVSRRARVVELTQRALDGPVAGSRLAVLGLAFKPMSDDVRNSQSILVAEALAAAGAKIVATDPRAVETARAAHPALAYTGTVMEAVKDADAILLLTEWPEYRELDPTRLASWTRTRQVVDARCVLDIPTWAAAGWTVHAPGRPVPLNV